MMEFDAFISYSTTDKTSAFAACAVLEGAGVRCWIAPRDIMPGGEYGAAIVDAIDRCRVMILIFSSSANSSQQIHREIERAVSRTIPIVPVRIEEVLPTKSMAYFLGSIHWLDALSPPIEKHLHHLADTVKAILQVDATARASSADGGVQDAKAFDAAAAAARRGPPDRVAAAGAEAAKPKRRRWVLAGLGVAACIGVLLLGGIWYDPTLLFAPEPEPATVTSQHAPVAPTPEPLPLPQPAASPPQPNSPPPAAAPPPASPPPPAARQSTSLVPETVPFIADREQANVRSEYLPAAKHKALAISFNRTGFITGQSDDEIAKAAALERCKRATEAIGSKNPCQIYAVGDHVVFSGGNPPMPPLPWLVRNPAIESPFAGKDLPFVNAAARTSWDSTYPKARKTKALALSSLGSGFYYQGVASPEEAVRRTLEACGYNAGVPCIVVAIDDSFVVPIPTTMKVTGMFHAASSPIIAAEWRDDVARRLGNAPNAWNAVAVGASGRPSVLLNASNEQAAIDAVLADCNRQDRGCRVIVLGPFSVGPAEPPK